MNNTEFKPPYFEAKNKLPEPVAEYVAWLDVMGIQSSMMRSLHTAANFIFKLHVAALEQKKPKMRLYPIMDGVYVTTPDKEEMRSFLSEVFHRLATCFNEENENKHRFLAKASVAFGLVIHGHNVNSFASGVLKENEEYKNSILLGMPVVLANQGEKFAPPFGIILHYSALDMATRDEKKWSHTWWPWFEFGNDAIAQKLKKEIESYFRWCEERAGVINYDPARIKHHRAQLIQYLVDA
ncbi:hypothetical protein FGF66_09045 [Chlorobaculum thiosulfatiphilum]|uniref:Uncharacterized protein n=1 Tax=Chlorobaculum thiosulfatiphilum TaxID=115852 RepID=A0A5C4S5E1_CHLTI|nr:hypothetical protein [Chlorobaculum thiosulfatiphilum]TNJ38397.1 hypothetical protein FGF66_09045 [Chlorobaculum thiosulfatiphilum]